MEPVVTSLLLLLGTAVHADPGWEKKVIGDVRIEVAAENMSAQVKATLGEESLTPWKTTIVSGRPARHLATRPDRTHQARQVTLIDDTRAKNRLVIVDIGYDSNSTSGKTDAERIMKSVRLE
jgi:hypothetical protein